MRFTFKADVEFDADDLADALRRLSCHFGARTMDCRGDDPPELLDLEFVGSMDVRRSSISAV